MNEHRFHTGILPSFAVSIGLLAVFSAQALTQSPGEIVGEQKISETVGGFAGDLGPFDNFGTAVAPLGDLNGDGVADLAVGAGHNGSGNPLAGSVWVLFMNADGTVGSHRQIAPGAGALSTLDHEHHFGASVATLGDLDGDGVVELAVGAPRDDAEDALASNPGALFILFMNTDGTVDHFAKLSAGSFGAGVPGWFDGFGNSVAGLGDLDGDGVEDLAAGSPGDGQAGIQTGAVWIAFLKTDGTVKGSVKITEAQGGFGGSLPDLAAFGSALGTVGDLDGGGGTVLAVGAPHADANRGTVWLLSLLANGTVQSQIQLGEGLGGFQGDLDVGDRFGLAVAGLGDLDADGVRDLAVGAPSDDDGAGGAGAVWLMFLEQNGAVASQLKISKTAGGFVGPILGGDDFGSSLALVAPYGPGGIARLAAGADGTDDGGTEHGAIWVLSLQTAAGVSDPEKPNPYPPEAGSFDGTAGRPALILLPLVGPGDDLFKLPLTVTPQSSGGVVRTSGATGGGGSGDVTVAEASTYPSGSGPTQAATADFDNDGTADAATSNNTAGTVSVLKGSLSADAPDLVFGPPTDFTLPFDGQPVAIVAGYFDNDSDPDLAVAGNGGVTIFRNRDLFTADFEAAHFAPVPFLTDLAVGDVTGDGKPDIVTASGKPADGPGLETGFATVLRGDGGCTFTNLGTFASGRAVSSVLLGQFAGTSALDALLAIDTLADGPGGLPQGTLAMFLGNGAGGFTHSAAPWTIDGQATGVAAFNTPHSEAIHPRWGALADLDLNGRLDAVYTNTDSIAFPKGTFGSEQPPIVLTVLYNNGAGGFDVREQGTGYVGRGVTPLLADFFEPPGESGGSHPDCMLVWYQDVQAGTANPGADQTFLAALVGNSQGQLLEASVNQFVTGKVPGDPGLGDFDLLQPVGDGGPAAGHLDVLVPNMKSNSLSLMIGDGQGGVLTSNEIPGVDETNPGLLPHGGVWVGGPRSVEVARLNNDDLLDAVSYNLWQDQLGLHADRASLSIFNGQGNGQLTKTQFLTLPAPGELALSDVDGDSNADLVVTRRTGGTQDELAVYRGLGNGQVLTVPDLTPVPAGKVLSGGIRSRDIDDDLDLDVVTTTSDGQLLIFENQAGVNFTTQSFDVGADWDSVRSLDLGDVTGDKEDDVVIGASDGRLFVAIGLGSGSFGPSPVSPTAAAVGGGALRASNLNGDGRLDVATSARVVDGNLDQAFVRTLLGAGPPGSFAVQTLPGVSSVGPFGALRPEVGDMNEDGAIDLVLAHGDGDSVSIHLNQLSKFSIYGAGLPGAGNITPTLKGLGYSTPGGRVELHVDQAVGGAPALMQVGTGKADHPYLLVDNVLTEFLFFTSGTPGTPGVGTFVGPGKIPDMAMLVGLELTFQAIIKDPAAGAPAQSFALTNGVAMLIVD